MHMKINVGTTAKIFLMFHARDDIRMQFNENQSAETTA